MILKYLNHEFILLRASLAQSQLAAAATVLSEGTLEEGITRYFYHQLITSRYIV